MQCKQCPFNNVKMCGVNFCVLPHCLYKPKEPVLCKATPRHKGMMDYHSPRWKRKRAHILKKHKYMCQESKRYGKRIDADTVHHAWPVDDYPEYAWCDWNLISLSNTMHNRMHDRCTNKLTALGEELRKRTKIPE